MSSFQDHLSRRINELHREHLFRHERIVDGPLRARIDLDGRSVLCFSSNDYLGLADHPALRDAVVRAVAEDGVGSGASRLIVGTHDVHRRAEHALAKFVGAGRAGTRGPTTGRAATDLVATDLGIQDAVLFSSGYAANVGVLQAVLGPGDLVCSDALNHASLIDGCRASRATVRVFPHADMEALRQLLQGERHRHANALVISDAVFSMDGDVAPLATLRALTDEFDAGLLIDEAHSLGVLGPEGRGACAAAQILPDILVGTLGKAFGAQGAFVAGSQALVDVVRNRARSYVFSTAPMPLVAYVIEEAVSLVRAADDRRARLRRHTERFRDRLQDFLPAPGGLSLISPISTEPTLFPPTLPILPILPIAVGDPRAAMEIASRLLERGIYVHAVRPPTVPEGTSRLRLVASAAHSEEEVAQAADVLFEVLSTALSSRISAGPR